MKLKKIYQRARIDKLLKETTSYPITAIVAGAGYGKTTAATEYLKKTDAHYVYIALTDDDAEVFWDKLCDALDTIDIKAADECHIIGMPVGAWQIQRAIKLVKKLCDQPFIMCIDDYQMLPEDSPVHALLETAAFENIPDFHILLLSRVQPNIRIATLVSKEMARFIDVTELCFTKAETEGYLAMRGLRLTSNAIDAIQEASDGWVSAIYLLGEGIRSGGQVQRAAIDTLFTENLLKSLSEIDRESLYRLSEFDVFCLDMAAYALGTEKIRDIVERLVRENAFITYDKSGWNHFHPLFRDYLSSRCPFDEIQKNVCRMAGMWCVISYRRAYWLYPLNFFEKAGCIEEYLSLLNKPNAPRINYSGMDVIAHTAMTIPTEKCFEYPFPYLQLIFYMMLSGQKQPMMFAGKLHGMMTEYFTANKDSKYRDTILGELIIIGRVTDFVSYEGEPLIEAAKLLGGRASDILDAADPFTFGLPMLLHSEYMKVGTLDTAVERCQSNAYELVTDGFGRGSQKLIRAEAALMRCQCDDVKHFAEQAIADAADKNQFFIIASAESTLMRCALFLGNVDKAAEHLDNIHTLIPTASRILERHRITIIMLREVMALADCFYYASLNRTDEIQADFLDGTHKSDMVAGLGVPQVYMARAMYRAGSITGAERMCDSLEFVPNVCQNARIYGLIISALCKEAYYGSDSGLALIKTALSEAEQDNIILPFAETPEIIPLVNKIKRKDGLSEDFLRELHLQSNAYIAVMPKKTDEKISLSSREREVLRFTAAGKSRANVAELFHVQENTIKAQLSSAYKKLGAKGKTEAIKIAKERGIL